MNISPSARYQFLFPLCVPCMTVTLSIYVFVLRHFLFCVCMGIFFAYNMEVTLGNIEKNYLR